MTKKELIKLGQDLLRWVKSNEDCFHEMEFFEEKGLDYDAILADGVKFPEFRSLLNRTFHTIGRRVLYLSLTQKCSALHREYLRFRMPDFNDFLHDTSRKEWELRKAAEHTKANTAIDDLVSGLDYAAEERIGPLPREADVEDEDDGPIS